MSYALCLLSWVLVFVAIDQHMLRQFARAHTATFFALLAMGTAVYFTAVS